jgi:hypothetical protein
MGRVPANLALAALCEILNLALEQVDHTRPSRHTQRGRHHHLGQRHTERRSSRPLDRGPGAPGQINASRISMLSLLNCVNALGGS